MIENLRKYTGLMIVALVLVFVGLILFVDTGFLSGRNRGGTVIRVDGRGYSLQDYRQLGEYSIHLAGMLQMYTLLGHLGGNPFQPDPEQFFINRVLVDRAQDEFGVHPSEEQVTRFLQEKSPFVREGKFDSALYADFIQKRIGRYGLSEADVRELVRDELAVEKLFEVVGSGLPGNFDYNNRAYASDNQRLTVNIAQFELSAFEEKQTPDEAAIKQFWEESKDAYKTLPRRKFSYFLVAPKYPEPAADAAKPEGEKKDEKPDEKKDATKAAADAAARHKADLALAEDVDNFLGRLEASQGGDFENLAKENGWEIKQTDFFTRADVPKDLDLKVRSGSKQQAEGTAADFLFGMKKTSDPLSVFTPAIPVGENQWLVARLNDEQPEAVKSFEDARDEARAHLIERLAKEALKNAAEGAIKSLREALAGGKSFDDAAKELNLKTRALGPFTNRDKPQGETNTQAIFQHVATVDAGTVADVLMQDERALIIHVVSRELVKEENLRARVEAQVNSEASRNQYAAFQAWLAGRRSAANVQQPARPAREQ